jgi:hypothetical protein
VANTIGAGELADQLAAGIGRPQPQLDVREPLILDPRDQALEAAGVVVILAEGEAPVHAHAMARERVDEHREPLGAGSTDDAEGVELDVDLGATTSPQRVDHWLRLEQRVGPHCSREASQTPRRSVDRLVGIEGSPGHGPSTGDLEPLFRAGLSRSLAPATIAAMDVEPDLSVPPPWLAKVREVIYFAAKYWWCVVATVIALARICGVQWSGALVWGLVALLAILAGPFALGLLIAVVSRARRRRFGDH